MPKYFELELDDGRHVEIEAAENATAEEVRAEYEAYMAARQPNVLRERPEPHAYQRWMRSGIPGAQTAIGALKGAADVFGTINQATAEVTDWANLTDGRADRVEALNAAKNAEYEAERGEDAGTIDWGRLAGQVAVTAPVAELNLLRGGKVMQMANNAIQGATGAAAVSSAYDDPLWKQATIGAVGGAIAPEAFRIGGELAHDIARPVMDKFRQASDFVAGKINGALGDLSSMSDDLAAIRKGLAAGIPEARDALQGYIKTILDQTDTKFEEMMPIAQQSLMRDAEASLKMAGRLTPEDLARRADMEALGVQGTAGAVTRNPAQWTFERNTAKVPGDAGTEITNRFISDNQALLARLNEIAKGTGGKAGSPYEAGLTAVDAAKGKWRELQNDVSALYTKVREELGDNIGLRGNKLFAALTEHSDEKAAAEVVDSTTSRLRRMGMLTDEGGFNEAASLSVSKAEELRKFITGLSDKGDPAIQRIKRLLTEALDDDVVETASSDAFRDARIAAKARFEEFKPEPLNSIVQNRMQPDDVFRRVLGAKVGELEALKRSMTTGTPEQVARGSQAWNDIRLQAVEKVIADSTEASGKLSGYRLGKALDAIGNDRLKVLFTPEELSQLGTIKRVAFNTTVAPAESAVNHSNTGAFLADLLGRMGVGRTVGKALGAAESVPFVGAAAKVAGAAAEEVSQSAAVARALNTSPGEVEKAMKTKEGRAALVRGLMALAPTRSVSDLIMMVTGDKPDGSGITVRVSGSDRFQ